MKFTKKDKVLLISIKGPRHIVEVDRTFFTKEGELKLKSLIGKKYGSKIFSNKGVEYTALLPTFSDMMQKSAKGPQGVLPKDAAMIVAHTGIGKNSKVLDAGTGSGHLAAFLARVIDPTILTSYEVRKEFIKVAKKNLDFMNIKNVQIRNKDIYKKIDGRKYDLITLDLAEPWKVRDLKKALAAGGYVVAYLPQMTQVTQFVNFCEKQNILVERIMEVQERYWEVHGRIAKPRYLQQDHTAFLVFARKLN